MASRVLEGGVRMLARVIVLLGCSHGLVARVIFLLGCLHRLVTRVIVL